MHTLLSPQKSKKSKKTKQSKPPVSYTNCRSSYISTLEIVYIFTGNNLSNLFTEVHWDSENTNNYINLQETTEAYTTLRTFITSTLLPVCKELQSYVANALTYFNDFNLDDFAKNILKVQPDDDPQTTSVSSCL